MASVRASSTTPSSKIRKSQSDSACASPRAREPYSTMSASGSTSCTACLTRSSSSARFTARLLCYVVSLCYVCLSCEVLDHLLLSLLQLEQIGGGQALIV